MGDNRGMQDALGRVSVVMGSTPLVLDSPHSGTAYPPDFAYACPLETLRRAEDTHVEKLYAFAPALGISWIEAHFPRSYLDANRDTTEVDITLLDAPLARPGRHRPGGAVEGAGWARGWSGVAPTTACPSMRAR